jgi:hypothetical protein
VVGGLLRFGAFYLDFLRLPFFEVGGIRIGAGSLPTRHAGAFAPVVLYLVEAGILAVDTLGAELLVGGDVESDPTVGSEGEFDRDGAGISKHTALDGQVPRLR